MNVRESILSFLRDTGSFASAVDDPDVWLEGLDSFVKPAIKRTGDYELRPAQEYAWRGLAEERVGLVLGPPGTGKTHLLAWLIVGYIQASAKEQRSCRVLVSAFTRNAIENLLTAVADLLQRYEIATPQTIYLGTPSVGDLPERLETVKGNSRRNLGKVADALDRSQIVVGATVWSLYKLLESGVLPGDEGLTAPVFDLICIDEASQMPLGHGLIALGALKERGRVVVAGDDKQLPPIRAARDIEYQGRNLGNSLYTFLKSAQVSEFILEETFRLNRPLTDFPRDKFYLGGYRSAVEDDQGRLQLIANWEQGLEKWEQALLDPEYPICVLVHNGPSGATKNPFEARLAADLVQKLRSRIASDDADGPTSIESFWQRQLAVISPHRAHNAEIRKSLETEHRNHAFVETVDRIQGKERDAVILSYCVSDTEFALAEAAFIFSPERLNVASTRARHKLVVLISRNLLEATPSDQELLDQAELLREFIYSCHEAGSFSLTDTLGAKVSMELRRRGFNEDSHSLDLSAEENEETDLPEMTPALETVFQAIKEISLANKRYGNASLIDLKKKLARGDDLLADLVKLHKLGWISLSQRTSKRGVFWVAKWFDEPRSVFPVTEDAIRSRIREVVLSKRSGQHWPFYDAVRDRFAWMSEQGQDLFRQYLEVLVEAGTISLEKNAKGSEFIKLPNLFEAVASPTDETPLPELTDQDFEVLNALEEIEARQINFGLFEVWISLPRLAWELDRSRRKVLAACSRLEANGYLLVAEDQRLRSRMGEIARELRYVKQRFVPGDTDKRPFLVRSLKIELRERNKPQRDQSLSDVLSRIRSFPWCSDQQRHALDGLGETLNNLWGANPTIAGFQARAFEAIFASWCGHDVESFVISADTGSGKTEAAILPMIAAALAERLKGQRGCRAIITYPRIRLASNQAQRIARYLAAVAKYTNTPTLTLGLQSGEVPRSFENLHKEDVGRGWEEVGDRLFRFPIFTCPQDDCEGDLQVAVGAGEDCADRLFCTSCGWSYSGWIGSKEKLAAAPPTFFLPTTESLHQWMHEPQYGALFGDDQGWPAPRAVLADEIHLYSHIHGAQVGYTLRRLLGRCKMNERMEAPPIAVGMSATLGDPAQSWERLVGRRDVQTIAPHSKETARNPRGREYFYFIQPEIESRGQDIAGASTTIQSLMCLSHNIRRRRGEEGGFRSLVFLDSIDKLRRLHAAFLDAEEGRVLPSLRTSMFGDDPATGEPIERCCKEPYGCDHFQKGECWWFAATDTRQESAAGRLSPRSPLRVCKSPVFSGTSGRVNELIDESDVVFSTSSLEVGFDDPDITLVYQHYAPQNLASFIQRKGRGGRGVDDRPITGVTLSIYSPRDSWWFRQPSKMINPDGFDVPLNENNFFVVRGQVIAAFLDGLARYQKQTGKSPWTTPEIPSDEALNAAREFTEHLFGSDVWETLETKSAEAFWDKAREERSSFQERQSPFASLRGSLSWVPNALFDTINLPALAIRLQDQSASTPGQREDIVYGLMSVAPGNVSRRFAPYDAHWLPPVNGQAPWLAPDDYSKAQFQSFSRGTKALLAELPIEARETLGEDLSPQICRPVQVSIKKAGTFHGANWSAGYRMIDEDGEWTIKEQSDPGDSRAAIRHETQAELRGFPIVRSNPKKELSLDLGRDIKWLSKVVGFCGEGVSANEPGLILLRSYWGSDCEVRTQDPNADPIPFRQIFTDPKTGKPLLHGFYVLTEGVQFHVNEARLISFTKSERARFENDKRTKRWHLRQFMRYLVESKGRAIGLNGYEAQRGAELLASAAADPALRKRLQRLIKFWDPRDVHSLCEDTRAQVLSQHPLLSERRVARVADSLSESKFKILFQGILEELKDATAFDLYLRSVVLHGLSLKLKDSFIRLGYGDERRVLSHVKLPIQFQEGASNIISLVEVGSLGDGTARTFMENIRYAAEEWDGELFASCPNAEEDAVLKRFFEQEEKHGFWRSLDPHDPQSMERLSDELLCRDQRPPAALLRILYEGEEVGLDKIEFYDLASEVYRVSADTEKKRDRSLTSFELLSAVVDYARKHPGSVSGKMLTAYEKTEDHMTEGSLSPDARLADQVFRLSAHLCPDGCPACLHQSGDVMSDSLLTAAVSRQLLERFLRY